MAVQRYGETSNVAFIFDRLLSSARKWTHDLNDLHLPCGRAIAEFCTSLVEQLLQACAITQACSPGEPGFAAIQVAGKGRSAASMRMGRLVVVFE